jgi:hypothetical protein
VKHAGPAALDVLEPLLEKVRRRPELPELKEKKRGPFYRKGRSFLHFHEDPAGLFADVGESAAFLRPRVTTAAEQKAMLAKLDELLRRS